MEHNYQQILRIAADALSLKYSIDHAVLYWQNSQNALVSKASETLNPGDSAGSQLYSISESLMSAIRKPLVISKSDSGRSRLQIIIPLIDNNQKLGVLAFWGKANGEFTKETDRRFLDMIGLISLRVLTGLQSGSLTSETIKAPIVEEEQAAPPPEAPLGEEDDDTIEFIEIGREVEDDDALDLPEELEEEPLGLEESVEDSTPEVETEPIVLQEVQEVKEATPDSATSVKAYSKEFALLLQITGVGFLIFNKDGKIITESPLVDPGFFGVELPNTTAFNILFEWGTPSNKDSASFDVKPKYAMILELMTTVFSRVTDIDVLKELFPKEIVNKNRHYSLDYHYMKSSESMEEDAILAVFTDVSKEKELTDKYNTEKDRTNTIIKVALDVDGYHQYRLSTEQIFNQIDQDLSQATVEIKLEPILHHIQAIQGGAEIYEINEVTLIAEEILAILEKKIAAFEPLEDNELSELNTHIGRLKSCFQNLQKKYLDNLISDEQILDKAIYRNTKTKILQTTDKIIEDVLKKRMEDLESTFEKNYLPFTRLKSLEEITTKRLDRIKNYIRDQIVKEGTDEIIGIMSDLRKQPIGLMLKRYAIIAVNLGERLNKRVEVAIKGAEIEVPFHSLENLFTSLIFVIRNCVEHGLETLEERIALNKSLEGNISIEADIENEILKITIKDDGRGIDVEKIKQAAINKGVITEQEATKANHNRILRLMFSRGFSTKKDSQGTFGRGVGLNAVGTAIEELGGDVRVKTKLKVGTTIEVEIPLQSH